MVPCWKLNHMLMHFFHSRAVKCGSCHFTCISTILVQVCTCSHVCACHICRLFDCITTVWGEELWGVWFCSFGNFLHWPFFCFVLFFVFCDEKNLFLVLYYFVISLQDNPFSKVKPMFIQDLIWHIRFFVFPVCCKTEDRNSCSEIGHPLFFSLEQDHCLQEQWGSIIGCCLLWPVNIWTY